MITREHIEVQQERLNLIRDLITEGIGVASAHLNASLNCNSIAADSETRHHLRQAYTCLRTISDAFSELDQLKGSVS